MPRPVVRRHTKLSMADYGHLSRRHATINCGRFANVDRVADVAVPRRDKDVREVIHQPLPFVPIRR